MGDRDACQARRQTGSRPDRTVHSASVTFASPRVLIDTSTGDRRGAVTGTTPEYGRLKSELALNRSVHRLDQVSRSLAPEDGVGSFVEVVEQVLDLWAGVERVVAVVFQVPVAPVQRP